MRNFVSFFSVNYNTSNLINCLIKSIYKHIKSFNYNIVIFDNSDREKLEIEKELINDKVIIIDNTKNELLNFDNLMKKYIKTNVGSTNNYASFKHAITINYALKHLNELYDNVILCDSDIIIKNDIDFIDENKIAVGQVKQTWTLSNERLLPMLCYLNKKLINEQNINYFDSSRFLGCSPGTLYDTGASFWEDIKNIDHKLITIYDYCIHLTAGSQDLYNNKNVDIKSRNERWINENNTVIFLAGSCSGTNKN